MSEKDKMTDPSNSKNKSDTSSIKPNPNHCIWKPPIKNKKDGKVLILNFPCRYPDKEKIAEVCNPCLLGDLFAMNYTQLMNMKQQAGINEEIMTYLRSFTSDGSMEDLR